MDRTLDITLFTKHWATMHFFIKNAVKTEKTVQGRRRLLLEKGNCINQKLLVAMMFKEIEIFGSRSDFWFERERGNERERLIGDV